MKRLQAGFQGLHQRRLRLLHQAPLHPLEALRPAAEGLGTRIE